jgi:hypothetical protein
MMLEILHPADVSWQEAMPQRQGDRDLAIHLKVVFSAPDRIVTYTRYDAGLVVAPHRHEGVEIICVLEGAMRVGEVDCEQGTLIILDAESIIGPIVAGDSGTVLLEIFEGRDSWLPRLAPSNEAYQRLVRERGITELSGPGREEKR